MSTRFITISVLLFSVWTIQFILITAVFTNFVRILNVGTAKTKKSSSTPCKESGKLQRKVIKINGHDKPLYCTGEERTAKSLILVFLSNLFVPLSAIL